MHCLYSVLEPYFFHVFLFLKISSIPTPLRVCMLRIYSAVILVLAMKSCFF